MTIRALVRTIGVVLAFSMVTVACTENFTLTWVNNTSEEVLAYVNGDGPITIQAHGEAGASYLESQTRPPYRILITTVEGTTLLDLELTPQDLEDMQHRIVLEPAPTEVAR